MPNNAALLIGYLGLMTQTRDLPRLADAQSNSYTLLSAHEYTHSYWHLNLGAICQKQTNTGCLMDALVQDNIPFIQI